MTEYKNPVLDDVDAVETPDGAIELAPYVPNIAETIKASGAHRQFEGV